MLTKPFRGAYTIEMVLYIVYILNYQVFIFQVFHLTALNSSHL